MIGFINLGTGELFVIFIVALIVFGPQKLPEMARNLGKAIRSFQAEGQKAAAVLRSAVEDEPRTTAGVIDRPDPPADREALAEPAPEGTERVGLPDDASAPAPSGPSDPPDPVLDQGARLLEDT